MFLSQISKYGGGQPSEEEFEVAREKLEKRNGNRNSKHNK